MGFAKTFFTKFAFFNWKSAGIGQNDPEWAEKTAQKYLVHLHDKIMITSSSLKNVVTKRRDYV